MKLARAAGIGGVCISASLMSSHILAADKDSTAPETTYSFQLNAAPAADNQIDIVRNNGITYGPGMELGMDFKSAVPGKITAIRWWKSSAEDKTTGLPHVGHIWSHPDGKELAQVTFTSETPSGWQQAELTPPLTIEADHEYTVSVNVRTYWATTTRVGGNIMTAGPLSTLQGSDKVTPSGYPREIPENNGPYVYLRDQEPGRFPHRLAENDNFLRDIVFVPATPAKFATLKITPSSSRITPGSTCQFTATACDKYGYPLANQLSQCTWSLSGGGTISSAGLFTASPTQGGPYHLTAQLTQDGTTASDTAAITLADGISIFTTQVPAILDAADTQKLELGTTFKSSRAGTISGVRYYKSPSETGPHTGRIWSSDGRLLASVDFASETSQGWQEVLLPAPLSLARNAQYIVTVNNNGHYAYTENGLTHTIVNSPLSALADGISGLYATQKGAFPTQTTTKRDYIRDLLAGTPNSPTPSQKNTQCNYFRDVIFIPAPDETAGKTPRIADPDPTDYVLVSYKLSPAQESQFLPDDKKISPFWSNWENTSLDSMLATPANATSSINGGFSGENDAHFTVRSAYGAQGLYLLFNIQDDSWVNKDAIDLFFDTTSSSALIADQSQWISGTMTRTTSQYLLQFVGANTPANLIRVALNPKWDGKSPLKRDTFALTPWTYADAQSKLGIKVKILPAADNGPRAIECLIPWAQIGNPGIAHMPDLGQTTAINFGYNDADANMKRGMKQLRLTGSDPGAASTLNPHWFDLQYGPDLGAERAAK